MRLCGLMGWSGNATIGFKATGRFYENHMLSGNQTRLVACINSTSNSSSTNIIYKLSMLIIITRNNCVYRLLQCFFFQDLNYLSFFTLGSTSGVAKIFFPSLVDTFSDAIYIPGGFKFGRRSHTTVYVRHTSKPYCSI